jgi:hydrogenase nickel incorporation protein HypA/HybF
MHELAITQDVLGIVLKHALLNNGSQVKTVNLRIGELRDIVDTWMQNYFDYLSRGTVAEGAKLNIERSPIMFHCDCGEDFRITLEAFRDAPSSGSDIRCSRCGSSSIGLCGGREFDVLSIEVI